MNVKLSFFINFLSNVGYQGRSAGWQVGRMADWLGLAIASQPPVSFSSEILKH